MAPPDGQRVRCSAKAIEPQMDNTSANPIHAAEPPTLQATSPAKAMTTPHHSPERHCRDATARWGVICAQESTTRHLNRPTKSSKQVGQIQ
jgi:hypothetical protein